ncbi:hypothetical protein [Roseburia faecis]|uniref:hypothetical protein n=1 Tax=Roseburia faecis TaxID=301302 RepID=UPI003F996BEA
MEPLFEETVDFDTFSKSDFRAVKVKECVAVPKSKKLLQFTLDDGTGVDRTILSGIHAYYEPEELVGKTLIAITNLPPRAMMGIESCGMLLSAVNNLKDSEDEELHFQKRYCYKKQVDIFQNLEYNISTKRGISSWKQDTKHKVFASVALATLKLCIYSLA